MKSILSIGDISELFATCAAQAGGRVADHVQLDDKLFVRSILRHRTTVKKGDWVEGGVAFRVRKEEVSVRPYVFRLLCENGACFPQSDASTDLDLAGLGDPESQSQMLRKTIEECGSYEAFTRCVEGMRSLADFHSDRMLMMMALMRMVTDLGPPMSIHLGSILNSLLEERDFSGYGFMNAITASARNLDDPEERWQMEEVGGRVPAWLNEVDLERIRGEMLEMPESLSYPLSPELLCVG